MRGDVIVLEACLLLLMICSVLTPVSKRAQLVSVNMLEYRALTLQATKSGLSMEFLSRRGELLLTLSFLVLEKDKTKCP